MNNFEHFKEQLLEQRPVAWDNLPDIELYMDQVISYMSRQHLGFENGEVLTSAMVNNYIKVGLLPRANGKKYSKEHLSYLTIICLFKQILPVSDVGLLLSSMLKDRNVEELYSDYCSALNDEYLDTAQNLNSSDDQRHILDNILRLAISSYAQKLACQQLLENYFKNDD